MKIVNKLNIDRIKNLREKALTPCISYQGGYFDFLCRYRENGALGSKEARYADAYTYAVERFIPVIDEGELLVGKPVHPLKEENLSDWEELQPIRDELKVWGQDSHMAIDYGLLLEEGTSGVSKKIDCYLNNTTEDSKIAFYNCAKVCLKAVEICADNYAKEARRLAEIEENTTRKAELLQIADICQRVPKYPATSFYEALQSISFFTYILTFEPALFHSTLQYQLGHPDRYLWDYYKKDISSGKIDKEFAQLLIDCLAIQINCRVHSGLSSGYMVGGRDAQGMLVQNDLTEMFMQAVDDVQLVYPAVGLCVTKETDNKYLEKACEILSRGRSHPAIFNDDIISEGLRLYGLSEAESREYIHSTCVEITPVAASSAWVASPYTNMPQLLLEVLDYDYSSMDDLLAAYFNLLESHIEANYLWQLENRDRRSKKALCPLLSCFVNDCLEKGVDIEQGGAKYQWIMPSFVGIANLVDSLYVLKQLVFIKKEYSLAQVREILAVDFAGFEIVRLQFLDGVDKYGNDVDEVDNLFGTIVNKIVEFCKKYTALHGKKDGTNRLIPSVFCWVMHEYYGTRTMATPDGRKKGFPFGDGSGPCQGREKSGPLASVRSSTKWSHKELIGGVAVNIKFSKKAFTSNSLRNITAIIKTFLERGGFEMQVNVVDRETLLAAQLHPEEYRDLVVRIGGYSDYFVRLSPQMQAEVLLRTEHEV